ncbi:MAG: hypothetical protein CMA91_01445 [Euryarchaeota archaeon]|nr:hypothetical protein [Euryarchaeota archaeon]
MSDSREGSGVLTAIGCLIIIVSSYIYVKSISTTGWFVPTTTEKADTMCISSYLVGFSFYFLDIFLDRKYRKSVEVINEESESKKK